MLARGKQIIVRHRRMLMIAAILAAVAFLVVPHLAMAADPSPSSPDLDKMYRDITKFITFILEFLQRLIWPILLLIGGLMKNDILFGAGMEDRMLAIWVQIRNLVNILFVLVLLGIAFYNVVGGSKQEFQLKGILPKFVIGLIAVNFSFIGVKLVVDTVNVMSTAIFALPESVQAGLGKNPVGDQDFVQTICQGIYGDDTVYEKNINDANTQKADSALCKTDKTFVPKAQEFFANFDAQNAGIVMAINLSKISEWGKVSGGVTTAKGLALNTMFAGALFIVFATAFVALFIVLLIRLVVLWVTLVLSPLIVLTYVLPESLTKSIGGGDLKTKFVANAIAPLPISLMMTIGFLMLQGMKDSKFTNISNLGLDTSSISMGLFTTGLSTLQELVIAVGTIAVIWMGVFEAAKGTYASPIVDKIAGAVKGVGSFAASSLKYAPIFPVSGAKNEDGTPLKMSMAGALGMADRMQEGRTDQVRKETTAAMKGFDAGKSRPYGDAILGAKGIDEWKQKVKNAQAGGMIDTERVQKDMGESMKRLNLKGKLILPTEMTDSSGKKIENYDKLLENLAKGTVSAETMRQIALKNTEGKQAEQVEPPKAGEKAGAGGTSKDDHDKAKTALDYAGSNERMLNGDQQKAAKAYRDAMNGKDDKKKNDALKAFQASGAIATLDEAAGKRGDFRAKAGRATDGAALDTIINDRRAEIDQARTKAGTKNADAAKEADEVNQILRSELDDTIKGNSAAVQQSGEAKKIKDKEAIKNTAPVAAYAEPAGGKKAGGGSATGQGKPSAAGSAPQKPEGQQNPPPPVNN